MIPQFEPVFSKSCPLAVHDQVKSGWVGSGQKVEEFERRIRQDILGNDDLSVVSTTSGTTALMLCILSLNLPKGSTILFPAYTFLAGANAAKFLGYKIKLVDIKLDTLCMNPDKIEVTPDVSAIMFVNHNGYNGIDLQVVRKICDLHKIPMIEDSCQCFGIPHTAVTGDVAAFSFSVPKIITTGQGGVAIAKDFEKGMIMEEIRDHGDNWRKTKLHEKLGINLKFNDILAAFGIAQLNEFDEIKKTRKNIWDWYEEQIPIYRYGLDFTWMVCHLAAKPDEIIEALKDVDIQATKYYKPVHKNLPYKTTEIFPIAEFVSENLLYLPSSMNLKKSTVDLVCEKIIERT